MSDNIRVAIRLRPLIQKEIDNGAKVLWKARGPKTIVQVDPRVLYHFDRVFDCNEGNATVYQELCAPIIHSVMEGFHGTIFAYGQTSSGKTHTMLGENGIIINAIQDIFKSIEFMMEREFLVRVSYMEIYREKVYDLLATESKNLKIQEDTEGIISVVGLTEEVIKTSDDVFQILRAGETKRKVAETQMNEHSSRSHAIFRMIVESRLINTDIDGAVNVSQLNLVDLAGSERTGQMGEKDIKLREGVGINKSLSHLSLVIRQLSQGDRKHVSFRNSILTRILRNSLGGNAHTLIICTVTPAHLEPTQSTINFASQAKTVKNKPTANVVRTEQALLKKYANKIRMLSEKLEALQQNANDDEKEILEKELQEKEKQNELLKHQIQQLKEKFIVSQSCDSTINSLKKMRRETVCFGALGHSRMRCQQENSLSFFNPLPVLQEEPIFDLQRSDTQDLFARGRKSSTESTSSISILPEKSLVHASVQTNREEMEAFRNLKSKIKTLALQLTYSTKRNLNLQEELAELKEFTNYENLLRSPNVSEVVEKLQKSNHDLKDQLLKTEMENSRLLSKISELEEKIESPMTRVSESIFNDGKSIVLSFGTDCLDDDASRRINPDSAEENSVFRPVGTYRKSGSELRTDSPNADEGFVADIEECLPLWGLLGEEIDKVISIMNENFEQVANFLSEAISQKSDFSASSQDLHLSCHAEIDRLERALAENNAELDSKNKDMVSLKTELEQSLKDVNDLEKLILEREEDFNEVYSDREVLFEKAVGLQEKLEDAVKIVNSQYAELVSLNKTINGYEIKIRKLREDIVVLSGHNAGEIESLKQENEKYKNDIQSLIENQKFLESKNKELREKISEVRDEYGTSITNLTSKYSTKIDNMEINSKKMLDEVVISFENRMKDIVEKHKEETQALMRHHALDRLQIEESATRFSSDYEKEIIAVISDLKEALDQKTEECRALESKLQKSHTEKTGESNLAVNEQLKRHFEKQQEIITELTNQCLEYSNQKGEYKAELEVLKQEIAKYRENSNEKLKADLDRLQEELKVSEQKYRSKCEKFEQHKKAFEEKIKNLKEQYKKDDVQQKLWNSAAKISSLTEYLKEKEEALRQESSKYSKLQVKCANTEAELSKLQNLYDLAVQKIGELESSTQKEEEKKRVQEVEMAELRSKIRKLQDEKVHLEEKLFKAQNELRRIQAQNDESKVEPKSIQKKVVETMPIAGSGAVNEYCVEYLESVVRSKDRQIRKLQYELEKCKQKLKSKEESSGETQAPVPKENADPNSKPVESVAEAIYKPKNRSSAAEEKYGVCGSLDKMGNSECKQQ